MTNESQDVPAPVLHAADRIEDTVKGSGGADRPSIRQGLHALTGDRDAEANALVDRSGDAVGEPDARIAVGRAHGDLVDGKLGSDTTSDIATPRDAAIVVANHESNE